MGSQEKRPGLSWHLLVVFVLMAAGIVAVGHFYYHGYEQLQRNEVERQLLAIAELKADELADWRREHLGDAAAFFKNTAFSALVRRHFGNPEDAEAQGHLRAWLGQFQAGSSYDRIFLLDAHGVRRMQVPDTPEPLAPHLPRNAAETLRSGQITFLDFHRDAPDRPIHLSVLVPVFDEQDGNRPLGVLALRIDPAVYLYPFIIRWPAPSPTAETLLVRREGDDVLFLNELRFQKNTALVLRSPLTRKNQPAVMAALGEEGIVEGADYRGVAVVAAVRAVSDSPWFLVARMDASEVYAPVRERLWMVIAMAGALLLGACAAVGVAWRQRSVVFYREKSEAAEVLRASEEKYRTLHESMSDAFVRVDLDGKIVEFNNSYLNMLGYSAGELRTLSYQELTPAKWHAFEAGIIEEQIMKRGYSDVYEKEYRRKDGTVFPVELRATLLRDPAGKPLGIRGIARDVTERKRAEEDNQRLAEIVDRATVCITVHDFAGRFLYANQRTLDLHGYNSKEEFMAINLHQLDTPESEAMISTHMQKLNEGSESVFEVAHFRKDGSVLPLEVTASIIQWGGRQAVLSMATDLTDRKKAESRVAAYQRRLRTLGASLALAEEHERRRIAADLHDDVVQALALAKIKLQTYHEKAHPGDAGAPLEEIEDLVGHAVLSTRSLLFDLSPPPLYELGLEAAVEWLAEKTQAEHKLTVVVEDDSQAKPISEEIRGILFRAVRELLHNTVKHAHARQVRIAIRREDPHIRVEVADDGTGINLEKARRSRDAPGGFGLFQIRERLDYVGGRMEIHSGHGMRVILLAPLDKSSPKA